MVEKEQAATNDICCGKGAIWYYLTYSYQYSGTGYEHTQPVWQNYYKPRDIGTPVSVCCLPENPAIATLPEDDFEGQADTFSVPGGCAFIGMGIFALATGVVASMVR